MNKKLLWDKRDDGFDYDGLKDITRAYMIKMRRHGYIQNTLRILHHLLTLNLSYFIKIYFVPNLKSIKYTI